MKKLPTLPVEIIKKTRDGLLLTREEIKDFIDGFTKGIIPDYQVSAWLMAVVMKGMTPEETLWLTEAMLNSGVTVDLGTIQQKKVDKHSTGGVGDKTSLILGPIVAACGVTVPMMSGRGLGHTGGTLDKLESIPGFNTQLTLPKFIELLTQFGIAFIGQTQDICPADKKLYALRDVTGTVESLELISSSIMSKKLAEDLDGLVLDVKFGSGAFMKTEAAAKQLALSLQTIGKRAGKKVTALLTNMDQPLGAFIGNSLEILESLEILSGKSLTNKNGSDLYADTRELSIVLAAHMIYLAEKAPDVRAARRMAEEALFNGNALALFEKVCRAQGGDLSQLPKAQCTHVVKAGRSGFIRGFNTEKIGILGIKIGAGRKEVKDTIDPSAGFQLHFKTGDQIESEDVLWTIFGSEAPLLAAIENELRDATLIAEEPPTLVELISEVLY